MWIEEASPPYFVFAPHKKAKVSVLTITEFAVEIVPFQVTPSAPVATPSPSPNPSEPVVDPSQPLATLTQFPAISTGVCCKFMCESIVKNADPASNCYNLVMIARGFPFYCKNPENANFLMDNAIRLVAQLGPSRDDMVVAAVYCERLLEADPEWFHRSPCYKIFAMVLRMVVELSAHGTLGMRNWELAFRIKRHVLCKWRQEMRRLLKDKFIVTEAEFQAKYLEIAAFHKRV